MPRSLHLRILAAVALFLAAVAAFVLVSPHIGSAIDSEEPWLKCNLTVPDSPSSNRTISAGYSIQMMNANEDVEGTLDFGHGNAIDLGSASSLVGTRSHTYPGNTGPKTYTIELKCESDSKYAITTADYEYEPATGPPDAQCVDTADNDDDGYCDYNGECNPGPGPYPGIADCGCTGFGDNNEDDYAAGTNCTSPPWVTITATTNLAEGGWTVTRCPPSSYNQGSGPPDCPVSGDGRYGYYDPLAGNGEYALHAKTVSGYRANVNDTRTDLDVKTVNAARGSTTNLTFSVFYEPIDDNGGTSGSITLAPRALCVTPTSTLAVSWNNTTGVSSSTDWIALVPRFENWNGAYPWGYWNGATSDPSSSAPAQGTLSLPVPANTASIEFIYYRANSFLEAARSAPIEVSSSCGGTFSRASCLNGTCVLIPSEGTSTCNPVGSTCVNTSHAVCDETAKQCVLVPGVGQNACATDQDCGASPPAACTMTAAPTRLVIPPPKTSTLSWECSPEVTNCRLGPGDPVSRTGTRTVTPTSTTTYTLTCDRASAAETVDVTVRVFMFQGGALKEVLPR